MSLIAAERSTSAFDPVRMNHFLEGSRLRSDLIQRLSLQLERDPIMRTLPSHYDLSTKEIRELTAHRINRASRYLETDTPEDFHVRLSIMGVFDPGLSTRIGINLGLFLSCIRGSGTNDQIQYWTYDKETCKLKGIYGCFGMTELAHGSNVAGLETTATFDKERDEFIVDTPHIGATKWWIGGAAHSATHCTVYARLIVEGKDYGVKTFVVPLRDANHDLCPGISVGDIGAKMGRHGIDNGWIQFSSVRIPRYFMLQRFCKVSRDGDVTLPPLEQLSYSALLHGRVIMVTDSFRMMARMSTIALRYAIGRRQFKARGQAQESQLIDYPLHQRRLFPYLAAAYVTSAGCLKMDRTIQETLLQLDVAVNGNNMGGIIKSIGAMKLLFMDLGSLKSTCTWLAAEAIDQCRQACGGHGYLGYNGFGKAYDDWVVQCTWEGDNSVLAMLIGKPIIKTIAKVFETSKPVSGSNAFLLHAQRYAGLPETGSVPVLLSSADAYDVAKVLKAVEVCMMRLGHAAAQTARAHEDNFDVVASDMLVLCKLKCHHYLLTEYARRVELCDDSLLQRPLQFMGQLYAASMVLNRFSGTFLTYLVASPSTMAKVSGQVIPHLCLQIRPHVVALTDSFLMLDFMINLPIGQHDGNIYHNYVNAVFASNPPFNTKAPYSHALEAMLNRDPLNVRDRFEKSEEAAAKLSR